MGKSAGSGSGSAPSRPRGTVFGVDGVSKTGSTAQDRAIGFTADGGKPGPNYEALRGATREQTQAAVAAAQQSRNPTEAQIAVRNILSADGRGQDAVNRAVEQAQAKSREDFRAGEVAGIGAQPPIGQGITAASLSPLASLLTQAAQTPTVDVSGVTNMALARGIQNPVYEAELNRRALAGDQDAMNLFDNALIKGYIQPFNLGITDSFAPDTLGVEVFEEGDVAGDLALNPRLLDGPPVTLADAQAAILADAQGAISADRVLAPAQVGPPAAQMQTIGPATQAVQGKYYGEDLQQPDIFGTPGGQFTELYGFPNATALGEFQTQAMRPSRAISQLMDFSLLSQGIGALTGNDPSEAALEGGRQSMRDILAAGGKFNPDTGRIEAALPSGQLQMNNLGMVTYSGMPDPNYAGPFANLVNPPEQERGGMQPIVEPIMEEEVVNPCPPGYALVDGVCQPLAGTAQPAAPAVVPSSFQPTYQPYQPQPLNPFVLSPTGAAIGRSV